MTRSNYRVQGFGKEGGCEFGVSWERLTVIALFASPRVFLQKVSERRHEV